MNIEDLFARDINRSINGVVKADQLDESSVWQELDEFVVTRELREHIETLVNVLLETIESKAGNSSVNGIWVSGFFGSGKSHFIKVLSYLLENSEHHHSGQKRRAVDFFDDKFDDAMLHGDLKRVVAAKTDTILFNVDSKADHRSGRDALLQVFLKVLNEKQGYSGDHPHIAHMERHLDDKGKLSAFHEVFAREAGESWMSQRDAWEFYRDQVVEALSAALGQSKESAQKWVDGAEDHFSLTVENFAKWVRHYLDSQGPDRRIMFLVDEVGQFIGDDTHLMLNLQTITEQLGTICDGRAWVVVTAQEDLESVMGDLKNTKQHDFSKIQGRFKTRLSLSSSNVDEVIKKRILEKKDSALPVLIAAYEGKHDVLKHQLAFGRTGMTFKTYEGSEDFATCYPFAAYQFTLVQKVFESIRKAGATGLHLSEGERSTLDAFQSAARQVGKSGVGALVAFYRFYPAVEGFLDTTVKRTIEQASENHALEPFDSTVLKVLFLIRYIEELPGSVDNLVTLCVDEIDADRLALRKKIEASLARLEGETLISLNGDLYSFLTNEERDISREIKSESIASGAEERELGKLVFDGLLEEQVKHTYSLTKRDFRFTRICDDHVVGSRVDGAVEVYVSSPIGDSYPEHQSDEKCAMHTNLSEERLIIRLPEHAALGRELATYLKTDAYVRNKHTSSLPETTKRILRDRSEDNRARRSRIVGMLKEMFAGADYFAHGQKLDIKTSTPKDALGEALEYLIQNAYPKMGYVAHVHPNPKQEIQSTLRANDVDTLALKLKTEHANEKAMVELREYVRLANQTNQKVVLRDLIEKKYGQRPYGWLSEEVILLVAQLAVMKELGLVVNGAPLAPENAYEHLMSPSKQRLVTISLREIADQALVKAAQELGKDLFGKQGPGAEDALYATLKGRIETWDAALKGIEPLAETGEYPGLEEIKAARQTLRKLTEEDDSLRFLKRFVANKAELGEVAEDYRDLNDFYTNQRTTWKQLRTAVTAIGPNAMQIETHAEAGKAFRRMKEILNHRTPYGMLKEVAALVSTTTQANEALLEEARGPVVAEIQGLLEGVDAELEKVNASTALRAEARATLESLHKSAQTQQSIAHIDQARSAAEKAFDLAMTAIEEAQVPVPVPVEPDADGTPEPPSPPVIKKRRIVEVRSLCKGAFIESAEDAEAFVEALRAELAAALAAGERIQIK